MVNLLFKWYGYLKKDFLLMYTRKKYLTIFILLPVIIGILFLLLIGQGSYSIPVAVCNLDTHIDSNTALDEIEDFEITYLEREDCVAHLNSLIEHGDYELGIVIPEDFSKHIERLEQSYITIYYDNTDIAFSNLLSWKVEQNLQPFERGIVDSINSDVKGKVSTVRTSADFLLSETELTQHLKNRVLKIDSELEKVEDLETEFILNPVWVNHRPLHENTLINSAFSFVFPILALFVILMLSSTSLIYDKRSQFITRVKSQTSPALYIFSKVVFFVLVTLFQFVILYLLFIISGARYDFTVVHIIELIVSIGVINSLLGFIIGLISENEGMAVLFSLMISFPLMLMSGIFYPVQILPTFVRVISNVLPLNYQISASKSVILFNQNISNNWMIVSVVLFVIVWYFLKRKI